MREDVEIPVEVPRKRTQVESALDQWLAVWLTRDDLSPSDRRRLQAERERRKRTRKVVEQRIGLIVSEEGMTPPQLETVCETIRTSGATEIVHNRLPRRHHGALMAVCRELGARARMVGDVRDEMAAARAVLADVDTVIAAPREATVQTYATPGVWSVIGLARHRSLPVQVVLPNGESN